MTTRANPTPKLPHRHGTDDSPRHGSDEAMLSWLAGDEAVLAAAGWIWDATGRVNAASRQQLAAHHDLEAATQAYTEAITACRIPSHHAARLGAALMLRIGRARLLAELDESEQQERPGS
jgi:hypothetical protein